MATVRLEFSPTPAHVRTARLVAAAVARRSGVGGVLLDEIRLAVGEACSRAVGVHRAHGCQDLIFLELSDGPRFTIVVTDAAPSDTPPTDEGMPLPTADPVALIDQSSAGEGSAEETQEAEDSLVAGMGLALLAGLVDDLEVQPVAAGQGTVVRMSWPLPARPGASSPGGVLRR